MASDFGGMKGKPILAVDFDGVIHSYRSGWMGPTKIPDEPVEGAIDFLIRAMEHFEVHIFSSRSRYWGGRRAMKKWLKASFSFLAHSRERSIHVEDFIGRTTGFGLTTPWNQDVERGARGFVALLHFPIKKPPAFLTLDDRAMTFRGFFLSPEILLNFKPWNKK